MIRMCCVCRICFSQAFSLSFNPQNIMQNKAQLILLILFVRPLSKARICHVVAWYVTPRNFAMLFFSERCFAFVCLGWFPNISHKYITYREICSREIFTQANIWFIQFVHPWFTLERIVRWDTLSVLLLFACQTCSYNGWWTFIDCWLLGGWSLINKKLEPHGGTDKQTVGMASLQDTWFCL